MWLRILLIAILIYLVVRLVNQFLSGPKQDDKSNVNNKKSRDKKVSRDVGEYVDYEELDD